MDLHQKEQKAAPIGRSSGRHWEVVGLQCLLQKREKFQFPLKAIHAAVATTVVNVVHWEMGHCHSPEHNFPITKDQLRTLRPQSKCKWPSVRAPANRHAEKWGKLAEVQQTKGRMKSGIFPSMSLPSITARDTKRKKSTKQMQREDGVCFARVCKLGLVIK